MTTTKTVRTSALLLTVPLLTVIGLAGCTNASAESSEQSPASASTAPTAASTPPPSPSSTPTPSGSTAGSTGSSNLTALVAAAKTATGAVTGSKVLSIEQEAVGTSWEVLVATTDGDEQEVHTAADGSSIASGPTRKTSDRGDLAENTAFLADYGIGYEQAARTMTSTVSGTVTELGLDDHLGRTVWEGDVLDSSGTKHSIRLNSSTGAVVTNTVDTDD